MFIFATHAGPSPSCTDAAAADVCQLLQFLLMPISILLLSCCHLSFPMSSHARKEYTNEFAVNLHRGVGNMDELADQIAKQHGFKNRGQVSTLQKRSLGLQAIFLSTSIMIVRNFLFFSA